MSWAIMGKCTFIHAMNCSHTLYESSHGTAGGSQEQSNCRSRFQLHLALNPKQRDKVAVAEFEI